MDLSSYNQKTKIINGEVVEEKTTQGAGIPPPSFSKYLIVGVLLGSIFKWYK